MTLSINKVYYNWNISDTNKMLLILTALFGQSVITEAKFKGQIRALRAGTLQTRKNLYHSSINGKWYDHEGTLEPFNDYITLLKYKEVDLQMFLNTILLYNGKGYNYAINIFRSHQCRNG